MFERMPSGAPSKPKPESLGRFLKAMAIFGTLMGSGEVMADAGHRPKIEASSDVKRLEEKVIEEMVALFPEAPPDKIRAKLRATMEESLRLATTEEQKKEVIQEMVKEFKRLVADKQAGKSGEKSRKELTGDAALEAARKPIAYEFASKFMAQKSELTVHLDELRFEAAYLEKFLEEDQKKYSGRSEFVEYERRMREKTERIRTVFERQRGIISGKMEGEVKVSRETTPAMSAEQGARLLARGGRDFCRSVSHLLTMEERMEENMRELGEAHKR